jgi:sensor histidine kinase YesM
MKDKNSNTNIVPYFKDTLLRIVGIPLISFLLPYIFFNSNPIKEPALYLIYFSISCIHTSIYWHIDRAIFFAFRRKLPKLTDNSKRLFVQSVTIIPLTLFLTYGISILTSTLFLDYIPPNQRVPLFLQNVVSLIMTILIISIYEAWYTIDLYKEGLIQNEILKKENTEAQLQTLKNQINPHFLFNSLNTLASVIPENQEMAVEFVQNLSKVYRYILQIKDKNLVTLKEELKCIKAYQYLLKIRFGENIVFNENGLRDVEQNYLIPLCIQMLIENAIKHNIVSKSKPLTITITVNDNSLSIKNNLQLKNSVTDSTKTGLDNIDKRFNILTNKSIQVNKSSTEFEVIIPLIKIGNAL